MVVVDPVVLAVDVWAVEVVDLLEVRQKNLVYPLSPSSSLGSDQFHFCRYLIAV